MESLSGSRPKRKDVQRAILEAAVEVFREDGYESATVTKITQRAGFTKGALYSNFGSKPELFAEVLVYQLENETKTMAVAVIEEIEKSPSLDKLTVELSSHLVEILEDITPIQIALAEFRSLSLHDDEVAKVNRELFDRRLEIIEEACQSSPAVHALLGERIRIFAIGLIGLVGYLSLQESAAPGSIGKDEAVQLLSLCLQGLLNKTP